MKSQIGKVFLVGAGPGDPDLITLRGIDLIRDADVILYDGLVNPSILEYAHPSAVRVCVGKHGHGGMWTQSEIDEQTVQFAKQGHKVVRLKGGDTAIFARTAEEVDRLIDEEIPYEIVPGITAAQAVTPYAGIPLTHRDWASSVAFVTGQLQPSDGSHDSDESLDWRGLSAFPGTLVFYMGVTTAKIWSQQLITHGKPRNTPVALIRRVSWPDQEVVQCELGTIEKTLAQIGKFRPPVIAVVGDVASAANRMDWFARRPLFGKCYLIPSPTSTAIALRGKLARLGAECCSSPALEIHPPDDWSEIDSIIRNMESFCWVVFSSANGIDYLLKRIAELGLDCRIFGKSKIATVGRATADRLSEYGLKSDLIPSGKQSVKELAEQLSGSIEPYSKPVLFIRTDRGKKEGIDWLESKGIQCISGNVYKQVPLSEWPPSTLDFLAKVQHLNILATSQNIAECTVKLLGDNLARNATWFCLSSEIADRLAELECSNCIVSERSDLDSLVQSVVQNEQK